MRAEKRNPAGSGGAVIGLQAGSPIKFMPAGARFPVRDDVPVPDFSFARGTWLDSLPVERRSRAETTWRAAKAWPAKLPAARMLVRPGVQAVPVFPVTRIHRPQIRNLVAWCSDRAEFLFWRMESGDTIKIGRAVDGLVIADNLADGLSIHAATGAAVLVVFGLFNLEAITPDAIRKRWRGPLAYAPAGGFRPPSAAGFSEPAAMARALRADLLMPGRAPSWVALANAAGLDGVRDALESERRRIPFGSGVSP